MSTANRHQDLFEEEASAARDRQGRSTQAATLAGMALFLLCGLQLIVGEIPHHWAAPTWLPALGRALFLAIIVLPPIGLGIGWIRSFPRWSYPYVGFVLLISLYMMNAATPGLRIFGYTFGSNDLWGWRAWIPFLVTTAIALLVTRSLRPALKLFTNAWQDWTLLTFGMFGCTPLLVALSFDEVDRLYSLPFMLVLTLVMAGTAGAYLRSRHQRQRVLSLLAGTLVTVAAMTLAPTLYWVENGWVDVKWAVALGAMVAAVMFSPLLLGLLRRSLRYAW